MGLFLTSIAKRGVSASTQNQAFNAVLFWYREVLRTKVGEVESLRAKIPSRVRIAPDAQSVARLLDAVRDVGGYPTRLIVALLYGCGLRVSEPLNLRIKDVDLRDSKLIIRSAKGGKDRLVAIPCSLSRQIAAQLEVATALAKSDVAAGIPVALPGLIDQKYPRAQFSIHWAWLFPARTTCEHPRTGKTVRWRCHEANVQRAVKAAATVVGIDVTPHHLRHAYATHCLSRGANPRALQMAMGHASLETTMGYIHADGLSVVSPMDSLR